MYSVAIILVVIFQLFTLVCDAKNDNTNIIKESIRNQKAITNGLILTATWDTKIKGGLLIRQDMQTLLGQYEEPRVDRLPHPYIAIMPNIHYLMPIDEVLKSFKINRISQKHAIVCPGFANRSFYYNAYSGDYGDGYNQMLLVTDVQNQLVAIQFVSENPINDRPNKISKKRHSKKRHSKKWHIYNLVQTKTKANPKATIAWDIKEVSFPLKGINIEGIIYRIDSEFANSDGKIMERNILYIPQPIINIILYILKSWGI